MLRNTTVRWGSRGGWRAEAVKLSKSTVFAIPWFFFELLCQVQVAPAMNAVQTRLRLPKCISFQCCRWKWLLAHAPSTRPPTYISTAKSTYIDQIAHLRLLVVVDMSPSTALALNTCRNTIWVHMCRHAHLRICRLPVHYASPNCCISTAKFIFTCQITHLRLKKASMMSTATYMAIQVSTIRMYVQNYICLLILQYMRCHCLSFLSFSQPIFLPW